MTTVAAVPDRPFVDGPGFPRSARIRLVNARVIDVEAGRLHPPGTAIQWTDGRIEWVGVPGRTPGPPCDVEIDAGGRTVGPGLLNTHVHLALNLPALLIGLGDLRRAQRSARAQIERNLGDCLLHGVTVVRDAWCEDGGRLRALAARVSRGELPGPRILRSILVSPLGGAFAPRLGWLDRLFFPLLGMRPIPYDDPASGTVAFPTDASPEAAARAVDRAVLERGAECIKIYDQREKRLSYAPGARLASPAQLEAIVDRARRRNVPVTMHQVTVESFRRGVAAGLTSLAHLPRDGPLDDADVEAFVASGCILEPTASLAYDLCHESADSPWFHTPRMRRVAALRERTAMELAGRFRVPAQRRAAVDGLRRLGRGETRLFGAIDLAPVFRYYAGIIGHGFDNLARLAGAGAPIACGNDAGAIPRTPAMVALELECLRLALEDRPGRVTLSGARALRIATLESARAVGLEKTHGRIAPGCAADLALWDGDPLADLRVIGSPVAALFRDGRPTVDRAGLTVRAPVARGGRNSPL